MTALAEEESPVRTLELPGQTGVADVLKVLWPGLTDREAWASARTLCRLHGEPDAGAVGNLRLATPVRSAEVPEDFLLEVGGGLWLRKWSADKDKRPAGQPRWTVPEWVDKAAQGGYLGAAKHGECTPCIKEHRLTQAVYRLSDRIDTYSRSSLCERHARRYLPMEVPTFSSPEEAQAWLDANS